MLRPELAFTIDYGQRPAPTEISSSKNICALLDIEHLILSAPTDFVRTGLMSPNPVTQDLQHPEFWPYRNQFILTCALMAAYEHGATEILIGSVAGDSKFADGTMEFIDMMNRLSALQGDVTKISAPAISMTTEQLLSLSSPPTNLLGLTFSCHRATIPCGDCPGCNKNRQVLAALYR
jgi:7-cyano-7-deazaguanine synthase